MTDVIVLHWPAQAEEAAALALAGRPRLLLVAPGADPPQSTDRREDWVRLPADERDVAARVLRLTSDSPELPFVDATNRLVLGSDWVALSPIEARLAAALARRFGQVVTIDELGRCGWPDGGWRVNAMRVHFTRLRRRVAPLGLEVRAVRAQGFVLQKSGSRET
jgi:DNA-binding response OmpR family regulator